MGLTAALKALLAPASVDELLRLRDRMLAEGAVNLPERPRAGYDRLVDGLNRLPRPLLALGSLAMMAAAMIAPDWFAARMDALAAVPEPLWWLIAAVVSLFFGSRLQTHAQEFRREMTECVLAACDAQAQAHRRQPDGAGSDPARVDEAFSRGADPGSTNGVTAGDAKPTKT